MFKNIIKFSQIYKFYLNNNARRCYSKLYEPDYLELMKPKYPVYETLNVQIKGYDFPVLESYQKFLHNFAENMDLEVSEGWAMPPQHYQVQRFKPGSAVLDSEYKLPMYERILQLNEVQAPFYPIFLRVAQAALPEGITLNISDYSEEEEERRYVPDKDLIELKSQLEDMGGPITPKKR